MKRACIFAMAISFAGLAQENKIKDALVNRIDTGRKAVGMVVGIVTPQGSHYIAHGLAKKGGDPVAADTIFEIGSVTKVFTSLLLCDMVERGELKLDDPISRYLPEGAKVPTRNGKQITLVDLATHTSGLPRDATNMDPASADAYAAFGPPQLYSFLSTHQLSRDPGERWEYSNIGAALLGHILTVRAGSSYEQLLRSRILVPLKMNRTTIVLSADQLKRTATGYDGNLDVVPLWAVDGIVGAGSIRSTAEDMLKFAAAQLGLVDHPLKAAMARMLLITRPSAAPSMQQHLGWAETKGGVLIHSGRRGGFSSALALRPETKTAVVVLSNSVQSVDDIAFHTLVPEIPLRTFAAPRKEIPVPEAILDTYAGAYAFTPAISIEITRENTQLIGQVTGQPKFKLYAEQEAKFFIKEVEAQITFVKDDAGAVTGLILHQNGVDQRAARSVQNLSPNKK